MNNGTEEVGILGLIWSDDAVIHDKIFNLNNSFSVPLLKGSQDSFNQALLPALVGGGDSSRFVMSCEGDHP